MAFVSAIDGATQRKMRGRGAIVTSRVVVARAWKIITLVISNENKGDVIRIIKSPENSSVAIGGVSETVNKEIKTKKVGLLACY